MSSGRRSIPAKPSLRCPDVIPFDSGPAGACSVLPLGREPAVGVAGRPPGTSTVHQQRGKYGGHTAVSPSAFASPTELLYLVNQPGVPPQWPRRLENRSQNNDTHLQELSARMIVSEYVKAQRNNEYAAVDLTYHMLPRC